MMNDSPPILPKNMIIVISAHEMSESFAVMPMESPHELIAETTSNITGSIFTSSIADITIELIMTTSKYSVVTQLASLIIVFSKRLPKHSTDFFLRKTLAIVSTITAKVVVLIPHAAYEHKADYHKQGGFFQ